MSAYKGHRGPNVSKYIANLNQLSPQQDTLADPVSAEEDFSAFLNADFYDVNNTTGSAVDFDAPIDFGLDLDVIEEPSLQPKVDRKAPRNSITNASAVTEMDFGLNSDFQFTDFNNFAANSMLDPGMQNLSQPQPNHFSLPTTYGLPTSLSPVTQGFDQASKKRKIEDVVPATPQNLDEDVRVAAEEDKRRRNTAASARFRVKKKQREQALEKTAKEMSEKVNMLEVRIQQLETENAWLKGLITEKNGGQTSRSELVARLSKHEEATSSSSRNKNTDGVGTGSPAPKADA